MMDAEVSDLIGKTLRHVVREGDDALHFVADNGERWDMLHEQSCCENVSIEDIAGDLVDLVGSPILMAEISTNSDDQRSDNKYPDESFTWTFYKLATIKGYVTIRWYGSSNGYYSETVSFRKVEWATRDAVEARLTDEIIGGDRRAAAVYADWLEERGEADHAAYVRGPHGDPDDPTKLVIDTEWLLAIGWALRLQRSPAP